MGNEYYVFVHETLGMHSWLLPSFGVGLIIIIMALVHGRNQKKREEEFKEFFGKDAAKEKGMVSQQ